MQHKTHARVFFYSISLFHHLFLLLPLPHFSLSFPLLTSPSLPLTPNSFLPELCTRRAAGAGGMALPIVKAVQHLTRFHSVFTHLNCSLLWQVQTEHFRELAAEQFSHCLDQGHGYCRVLLTLCHCEDYSRLFSETFHGLWQQGKDGTPSIFLLLL